MSLQIHTHNTNIPSRELITMDFPWYKENSSLDSSQSMISFSQESRRGQGIWEVVVFTMPNEEVPTPFVSAAYTNKTLQIDSVDSSTNRLENLIAEKLFAIPEVEYVFLSLENDLVNIWTIINTPHSDVKTRIYEVEYEILGLFKDLRFDFHVIFRNNADIDEVRPSNAKILFNR